MPTILREFFRAPKTTGAIASSSRALARTIVGDIGLADAGVIVEYGPGTGVFTREILARKRPGAAYLAIEANPRLAERFAAAFPEANLLAGSAERVGEGLADIGAEAADCIVSGLPWAAFDADIQDRLLNATLEALRPGGRFATFAYLQGLLLASGKRFRRRLDAAFAHVARSRTVWWNLPPAFVYRCTR